MLLCPHYIAKLSTLLQGQDNLSDALEDLIPCDNYPPPSTFPLSEQQNNPVTNKYIFGTCLLPSYPTLH
jgi:hypothetical protein